MTGVQQDSVRHEDDILAPVLRAAHEIWIRETDRFLSPVIVGEAPFWGRWTAVRYLADQFLGQYRRERALVDEVRPFLPPPAPVCLAVHGVFAGNAYASLQEAGAAKIVTCNTITHPSNQIDVSRLVATAVEQFLQASGLSAPSLEAAR